MLKKIIVFIGITSLLSIAPKNTKASHIAGGEITYTCLGGNQYQINLNLFVDCLGFNPGASQIINFTSTCGGTATLTAPVTAATTNGLEISQLCPASIPNSTCNGGTLPGMWLFSYTGVVTLAPPCDTWTMSWSTCCRNSAITNVTSFNYYIEATLNSGTALCNSSPQFTAQPIPYVCLGQTVNYSYGVVETDGDSLFYSLIPALDAAGVPVTYAGGYSGTSPIPGITIDPVTGLVTFTPGTLGNFVVAILVQEYDAAGNLVGTVMRDIQFVVQNCTNVVPAPTGGGITSFSGNAVQTGPYSIEMCAGNCFNFTTTYTDADAADILTYISNITTALPGATITSTGTNPLTLDISWCSPAGTMGQNLTFTVTIQDGACPIQGQQVFVYNVNILDATTASPDITICGTQTAALNAYGGSIFNWSVVSGPAMTPANFSCNPCDNPVASPTSTTTYEVVSNLSGTCDNIDTVTVFVAPTFTYNVTQSSTTSCLQDPIQLDVTGMTPAGAYTFLWTPAANLSSSTIANPVATFIAPGTYSYTVTVTSPFGCVQQTTVSIFAAPAFSPQITAYNDTTICAGGVANLVTTFNGGSSPPSCGLSATGGCSGASIAGAVGTGTGVNTSTTWPAIFGNWYTSTKHQMLFTAAELNAAGITGGKIDQLDFNVQTISGITIYHQFTIKMGCTTLNALGTTWESGLVQVFNPATVNVVVGWNTMMLNNAFEWDGLSNIIVEVCSTEGPPYSNYTTSCISQYTTTTFTSCLYSYTDSFDMCPDLTNWITATNNRPNIQFHYCSIVPNPANYTYLWTTGSGTIASPTSQNTTGTPAATTDYIVTVTDIAGGCFDTDTIAVTVLPFTGTSPIITAVPNLCTADPAFNLTVDITGGIWSGPGITNDTLGTFDPSTLTPGTYIIGYTSPGSCNGADTVIINVIGSMPPVTSFSYNTPVCPNDTNETPSPIVGFSAGGTYSSSSGLSINSLTGEIDVSGSTPGTYTVTYNFPGDPILCLIPGSSTSTFVINTFPSVIVSPEATIYIGQSTTFFATGASSYSWTPSDGACLNAACDTLTVAPAETTTYCVTATNINGCIDSTCTKVNVVIPCPSNRNLAVPNAFSPNGDGNNDEFCLDGWDDCVVHFRIVIFNRWGEKIFESTNANFCWDGNYRGQTLDPGVFVYYIKASYSIEGANVTAPKGLSDVSRTGNISLVR